MIGLRAEADEEELARKIINALRRNPQLLEEVVELLRPQIVLILREEIESRYMEEIQEIKRDIKELKEEVRAIRLDVGDLKRRVASLEEGQRELKRRVASLEEGQNRLWSALVMGFEQVRGFAGVTFEEFVRKWFSVTLVKWGVLPEGASLERKVLDGEEIDLFHEDPLVVGEVTSYVRDVEKFRKFVRKIRLAEERYGRRASMKLFIALTAPKEVAKVLRKEAEKEGVFLIIGKEIPE